MPHQSLFLGNDHEQNTNYEWSKRTCLWQFTKMDFFRVLKLW